MDWLALRGWLLLGNTQPLPICYRSVLLFLAVGKSPGDRALQPHIPVLQRGLAFCRQDSQQILSWCDQNRTVVCDQNRNNASELLSVGATSAICSLASAEDRALRGRNLSAA